MTFVSGPSDQHADLANAGHRLERVLDALGGGQAAEGKPDRGPSLLVQAQCGEHMGRLGAAARTGASTGTGHPFKIEQEEEPVSYTHLTLPTTPYV